VSELSQLAAQVPETWIVLDESFLSLSERAGDAPFDLPRNVVRVRSLTKDHALPGVRVGYLLGTPELVAELDRQRAAWSCSAAAQAVAELAPQMTEFVAASRAAWLREKARLSASLAGMGYRVWPSSTGFFVMRVQSARELRARLLTRHALLVRDCTSFGLPEFVRIGTRGEADNQRLSAALAEELQEA
jgi:histidinol-phosphate/aromatic aminotransferase/cobyric acid decarboxylase-like protein